MYSNGKLLVLSLRCFFSLWTVHGVGVKEKKNTGRNTLPAFVFDDQHLNLILIDFFYLELKL